MAKTGSLKSEPANQGEFNGLLRSGKARLTDAANILLPLRAASTWPTTHRMHWR
jgi:hypothetical protein